MKLFVAYSVTFSGNYDSRIKPRFEVELSKFSFCFNFSSATIILLQIQLYFGQVQSFYFGFWCSKDQSFYFNFDFSCSKISLQYVFHHHLWSSQIWTSSVKHFLRYSICSLILGVTWGIETGVKLPIYPYI